jgi:TonB-dependent receptor
MMMKITTRRSFGLCRILAGGSLMALTCALAAPAAAQTTPAPAAAPAEGSDVVVTGQRAAQRAAIDMKRNADSVTEMIVADDVGKLPDQNVAEAVKRLPGLSVANDQGEGRYVIIRGVNPNLVNVTVNGNTQPAPEPDGRQVKLDDIPSSLIQAVTISKSLTADQDANAIGGAVDIRTLSAFDKREHFFVTARGEYGRYNLNGKNPWGLDGQIGGRVGDFGAVLSLSTSYRPIESENFQSTTTVPFVNGRPDQYGLRDYNLVRKRTGAVLNLDWHPSTDVTLYLRGTYSKFSDNEVRDQNRVDSIAYTGGASGTFIGRPSILIRRRIEDDNTKSLSGGGIFRLGGGELSLTGAWASAVKNDPLRSEYNFRGSATGTKSVSGTYDVSTAPYTFVVNPAFVPANYSLNSVNYDNRHAQEDLYQFRADYSHPIPIGDDSSFKFGFKYLNRHKTNDRQYQQYGLGATAFTAANASYTGDTDFYNGMYVFGPRISYDTAQAYVAANPTALAQSAANLTTSRNNSLINDYDVRERITSLYAMATLKFGDLTVIPGVRMERTVDDTSAKVITAASTTTQDYNSFGHKAYTYFFPGINVKFEPVHNLVIRAAATTSLARPNYPDLAPYVSIDLTTTPNPTITEGNPQLTPYKAVNLDATLEYYVGRDGTFSVGAFYKDISNPIYTQQSTVANGTFGGQTFALASVNQPVNATRAIIKGIEFNAQYQFTFLPGPLSGFGVSANYTIVGGHGTGLPNRPGEFPLFFQSNNVGSVQLTYEKYGISARVAYSYRSKYLDLIGTDTTTDQYTDSNGQIDARIGYDINSHITIYAEGVNLNDAPWRRFIGVSSQLVEREHYGRLFRGGVQVKF